MPPAAQYPPTAFPAPLPFAQLPQEMEKTAKVMQEDMPLTFQDMQRTSKEFGERGRRVIWWEGGWV